MKKRFLALLLSTVLFAAQGVSASAADILEKDSSAETVRVSQEGESQNEDPLVTEATGDVLAYPSEEPAGVDGDISISDEAMFTNDSFNEATPINLNTTYNLIFDKPNNYFKFTITDSPGYFYITSTHDLGYYYYIYLYSENNKSNYIKEWSVGQSQVDFQTYKMPLPAGVYYIRVYAYNPNPINYSIRVDYVSDNAFEVEYNNSFTAANGVTLNTQYNANFTLDDVDYFSFSLPQDGYISLETSHDQGYYYYMYLYRDVNKNNAMREWSIGRDTVDFRSCNIGLPAGKYYVRFNNSNSANFYSFKINYTASSTRETEYNDSFKTARNLAVGSPCDGSLFTSDDKDFYVFELEQAGNVTISFDHSYIDSTSYYFKLYLYADSNKNSPVKEWTVRGNESEYKTSYATVPAGKYYAVVDGYGWTAADYQITVNYTRDLVEGFVTRMYKVALDREPDAAGLNDWTTKLKNGQAKGADIAKGFYLSTEMKRKHLSNPDYVEAAYVGIMGRGSDAAGKASWVEFLDAGASYAVIVRGFVESNEFKNLCSEYGIEAGSVKLTEARDKNEGVTKFVSRLYTKALGRGYDVSGMNYWCDVILKNSSKSNILNVSTNGFFHSDEFRNKNLSDRDFVTVCYRTFLGREADQQGYDYWCGKLAEGMSRDSVMAGFANSKEFAKIMSQYGL